MDDTLTSPRLTLDLPLLRKSVEWAESEATKPPLECAWDQTAWRIRRDCGTSFCVAGYVCEVAGLEWTSDDAVLVDGEEWYPGSAAAKLLGITYTEKGELFAANNTIGDVRQVAEEIAARRGETL